MRERAEAFDHVGLRCNGPAAEATCPLTCHPTEGLRGAAIRSKARFSKRILGSVAGDNKRIFEVYENLLDMFQKFVILR